MFSTLYNSLVKCLKAYGYDVSRTITEDVPGAERKTITPVMSARPDAVIAVSCLENPEDYRALIPAQYYRRYHGRWCKRIAALIVKHLA